MSFTLIDLGSEKREIKANMWTWKAVLEVIKSFDVLSEGKIRQMKYNATGIRVSKEEAEQIANGLNRSILPNMAPGKRIYADLSVTGKPDDGTLYRDEKERWKNYSADFEWLEEFSDFCRTSDGFQVF